MSDVIKARFKISDIVKVVAPHLSGRLPLTDEFVEDQKERWASSMGAICIIKNVSYHETPFPGSTNFVYSVIVIKGMTPFSAWINETCFELVSRHKEIENLD